MAAEEIEITIEIVCTELPGAGHNSLYLGIQRDKVITEAASADSKRVVFKLTLRARRNDDGSVNFLGPFAQGPKTERFIYLNWATTNGTVLAELVGRIKLHLNHIKWATVEEAREKNKPIRVKFALTNAKGKPGARYQTADEYGSYLTLSGRRRWCPLRRVGLIPYRQTQTGEPLPVEPFGTPNILGRGT